MRFNYMFSYRYTMKNKDVSSGVGCSVISSSTSKIDVSDAVLAIRTSHPEFCVVAPMLFQKVSAQSAQAYIRVIDDEKLSHKNTTA